eukprot:4993881-Pyramimonas_sp.AAC.1
MCHARHALQARNGLPSLPRSPTLARIGTALRDHPLRILSGVEKISSLPRSAVPCPARLPCVPCCAEM